jgi:RNA polymerase sigma-70 factor, ECF subfamily
VVTESEAPLHSLSSVPAVAPEVLSEGFQAIYSSSVSFVFRTMKHLGVPRDQIEDAVQDVFLVVLRRLSDFEGRSTVRTWIYGIAIRVARDHMRKAKRRLRQEPLPLHLAATRPTPLEEAAQAERVRILQEILATLSDEKRAVFVLADIEGLTVPEVAAVLDVKLNTVYSRLRLARADVAKALERLRAGEVAGERSERSER